MSKCGFCEKPCGNRWCPYDGYKFKKGDTVVIIDISMFDENHPEDNIGDSCVVVNVGTIMGVPIVECLNVVSNNSWVYTENQIELVENKNEH
jgi:hypothetical protein